MALNISLFIAKAIHIMTIMRYSSTRQKIKEVIAKEGGCVAWGSGANLSPADDILIRIERALDLDSEGQLIASVLSKKVAAGSTHLVVDMPVGDTVKLRSIEAANHLKILMIYN